MKLILIIIPITIIFFSKLIFSQNIVVINLKRSQKNYLDNFEIRENELQTMFNEIEESKLILSEKELNNKIDNYNNQLNKFNILVDQFNYHYQNEIILIREKVLEEIFILLEKYAIDNQVDLILDSRSYLIASDSMDITKNFNH